MMFCCGSPILQEKVLFKNTVGDYSLWTKNPECPFVSSLKLSCFILFIYEQGGGNIYNTWANNYYFISGLCFHLNVPTMIATWFFLAFIFTFNNKKGVSWFLSSTTFIEKMRGGEGYYGSDLAHFFDFFKFWAMNNLSKNFMAKQNNMLSL